MPICLLHKTAPISRFPVFYRVEIAMNLFGEWSVLLEWGRQGGLGIQKISLFTDLLTASKAADRVREKMLLQGYQRA